MTPLPVRREDGACRSCGGELHVIDADDATMTVECQDPTCGACYAVEPDAFGDGCLDYYVPFIAKHGGYWMED